MIKYLTLVLALAANVQAATNNAPRRFRDPKEEKVAITSLVEVTETCIDKEQEIVIHFHNGRKVKFDDWVGVYPQDYDPREEPLHWVHTCGTDLCEHAIKEGTISIAASLLPPGDYIAVLARDHFREKYNILGESAPFSVVHNACDAPDER